MNDLKNDDQNKTTTVSLDLERLSQETGISVEMLQTLEGIFDPKNAHRFTAESARKAFAHVQIRDVQLDDEP